MGGTASMLPTAEPIVSLDGVSRILTDGPEPVTLVEDIDLAVYPGEVVAITGPSGSGKSSLIYLIGLLDDPTVGRIMLSGRDATRAGKSDRERMRLEKIGFVFQFHFLLPEFSARDNVMLPMRKLGALSDDQMRARADLLLGRFGLAAAGPKRPHQLSGGERQRVAIARALANDPRLVLADEPTGNLDSKTGEIIYELLNGISSNRTVLVVTHAERLAALAERVLHINDGRLL